jgi:hypothetical protein
MPLRKYASYKYICEEIPMAAASQPPITPFQDFVNSLHAAKSLHYLNVPNSAIGFEGAFDEIRAHLVNYYAGAESMHSFVDANGAVFDCIPIDKQLSRRGQTSPLPVAPDLPGAADPTQAPSSPARKIVQLHADFRDPYGNQMLPPDGTIPVRRLTLEGLARFKNLRDFLQKRPGGGGGARPPGPLGAAGGGAPGGPAPAVAATHRWAHAYQSVANLGGGSFVNIWDPAIGANQIFSLSQHWYVGGGGGGLQTAEVGWQVYPQKYSSTQPCLFIYWTADDYGSTGCYNLDCNAFVQTNKNWAFGGALGPVSTNGGAQYELDIAFFLYQGNWWLYLGGEAAANAVGYYPTSLYRGGAMASAAAEIDYGGETVGTTSWPPMGSGQFAATGWQHAAYQRGVHYFPTGGGRLDAALTQSPNSGCYTAQVVKYNPTWSETLWFGGPGGSNC